MYTEIGAKIRSLRLSRGISQKELAGYLEVTFQQLQKYEKGHNKISVDKLLSLSEYFRVPFNYFLHQEDAALSEISNNSHQSLKLLKVFFAIKDEKQRERLIELMKALKND